MTSQPIPSIKIILTHKDRIMMLKLNENGQTVYDLPGGRMEYGEGIFETLKREIKEEIGVDLEFKIEPRLLNVNDYLHPKDKIHRLMVHFTYEIPEMIVKRPDQGEPNTETVWLSKNEISQLPINTQYKGILLKAFEK